MQHIVNLFPFQQYPTTLEFQPADCLFLLECLPFREGTTVDPCSTLDVPPLTPPPIWIYHWDLPPLSSIHWDLGLLCLYREHTAHRHFVCFSKMANYCRIKPSNCRNSQLPSCTRLTVPSFQSSSLPSPTAVIYWAGLLCKEILI